MIAKIIGGGKMGMIYAEKCCINSLISHVFIEDINPKNALESPVYNKYSNKISVNKDCDDADFVIICTPPKDHINQIRYYSHFNIPMLVEKPVVSSLNEINDIPSSSYSNIIVGYCERYNKDLERLKDCKFIRFQRLGKTPNSNHGVDVNLDLSVHDIDLARFVLEEDPLEIRSYNVGFGRNYSTCNIDLVFSNHIVNIDSSYFSYDHVKPKRFAYGKLKNDDCFNLDLNQKIDKIALQLNDFINFVKTKNSGRLPILDDGIKSLKIALGEL